MASHCSPPLSPPLNAFNNATRYMIADTNMTTDGEKINFYSDFTNCPATPDDPQEFFEAVGAIGPQPDPCFQRLGAYDSFLSEPWVTSTYTWQIVLQKKPERDIKLHIVNCVLNANCSDPFDKEDTGAAETGWYVTSRGSLRYVRNSNLLLTVKAVPGPNAMAYFTEFYMDARSQPGAATVNLENRLYMANGLSAESIELVMHVTGKVTTKGDSMYTLTKGDRILITLEARYNCSHEIRYGVDSVSLHYISADEPEYLNIDPFCGVGD